MKKIFFLEIFVFFFLSNCNPFAPALDSDYGKKSSGIGDQLTIDGVFQVFRYSYNYKDTLLYGKLISDEFLFIFRDYEKMIDVAWGRDEDMLITNRMFQNTQNLDLMWSDIFSSEGDSLSRNVIRYFNLSITFNPNEVYRIDGKANLTLSRNSDKDVWKIRTWRDESNF